MIYIKSASEIAKIKQACLVWKIVKKALLTQTKVAKTLKALDLYAKDVIEAYGCSPTFHLYHGFPGNICISVNDEVIHGIGGNYALKAGDLITYDVGVSFEGYVCDAAFSVVLGENKAAKKINQACYQALYAGINAAKANKRVGDISAAIQTVVEQTGYFVLEDFGGHGCGRFLHEDPLILNYGLANTGPLLQPNMVICIEPMILTGAKDYYIANDRWTVIAQNHKLSCHWEHMVLITQNGNEILTEDD